MNIALKTFSGACIARPDTTKAKVNEDIFLPDFVTRLSVAPVLYALVSRPGRSVGAKFASRYFDKVSYGLLLYPENIINSSIEGFAVASCLDHTTYIPDSFYNSAVLDSVQNSFILKKDGNEFFRYPSSGLQDLCDAVVDITKYIYIRTGDLVALELSPRIPLCSAGEKVALAGFFSEDKILDINIIL